VIGNLAIAEQNDTSAEWNEDVELPMTWKRRLLCALASLTIGTPALAHHSGAMFDRSKTVTLQGTVKDFQFTNPHVWILLLVPQKDGQVVEWDIEASAPARLIKWGISGQTVHNGDKITLNMHPLKDGRKGGILVDITFANGTHANTDADVNAISNK
jgi:hypothetical protein